MKVQQPAICPLYKITWAQYRAPNSQGYVQPKAAAGRGTREEAKVRVSLERGMIAASLAPDQAADCPLALLTKLRNLEQLGGGI